MFLTTNAVRERPVRPVFEKTQKLKQVQQILAQINELDCSNYSNSIEPFDWCNKGRDLSPFLLASYGLIHNPQIAPAWNFESIQRKEKFWEKWEWRGWVQKSLLLFQLGGWNRRREKSTERSPRSLPPFFSQGRCEQVMAAIGVASGESLKWWRNAKTTSLATNDTVSTFPALLLFHPSAPFSKFSPSAPAPKTTSLCSKPNDVVWFGCIQNFRYKN